MARIIICCLVICLAVVFSEACHPSGSGSSYDSFQGYYITSDRYDSRHSQDVPGRSSIYSRVNVPNQGVGTETPRPNYYPESGSIDFTSDLYRDTPLVRDIPLVRVTPPVSQPGWWRSRRDVVSQKDSIFKLIDMNGNKYIEICEWVEEGGSAKNFVAFLSDDDTDGDEKISWQEFQAVNV